MNSVTGKQATIRLGAVGLGRAFTIMVPTFQGDPRVSLVAGVDPRPEARTLFEQEFGGTAFERLEDLLGNSEVDAIYLATPVEFHKAQLQLIADAGKHVLMEKPMGLSIEECQEMTAIADQAGIQLIVGHSHSFDLPILRTRQIIESGNVGSVRMINAFNYTDFMYRPRRPDELSTAQGGGVVFSQAAHQIDVIRLLGGGLVKSVRASTGIWDQDRPTEGAYSAMLFFEDGLVATASYSGYAHFDSDEFMDWRSEMGSQKDGDTFWTPRRKLGDATQATNEADYKASRNFGGAHYQAPSPTALQDRQYQHFGTVIASCEKADLRPMPWGVEVNGNDVRHEERLPDPAVPRSEVIDELVAVVNENKAPRHSGAWATATLEVCLAILESSKTQKEIELSHQVGLNDD